MQQPLFPPTTAWKPTPIASLPSWAEAKRVVLDFETKDEHLRELGCGVRRGGRAVGYSFAIEDGASHYVPFGHEGGDNLSEEHAWAYLREQAAKFKGDLCGANLGYDLDYAEHNKVHFRPRFFRDVQVAEPLLDELQDSYALDAVAQRHGLPGKDEHLLREAAEAYGLDPKAELWKLPARFVGPYASQDARAPLAILRRQERLLEEQELWPVYDLESRLLPVLVAMRRWGVRVDFRRLEAVEQWTIQEERAALAVVKEQTGVAIDLNEVSQPKLVLRALAKVGVTELQLGTTPKGKTCLKKGVLEAVGHPVAKALLRARQVLKVRTDFCASVRAHVIGDRIHCTFNQLRRSEEDEEGSDLEGGRFGRLSCVDPNLQQQPARDPEIGPMWRAIYVPDEGSLWGTMDYSQQEPRMAVHYGVLAKCDGAEVAAKNFWDNPNVDFHQMMAELTALPRKKAKNIFLGLCYGMGGAKLCDQLGLPTEYVMSQRLGRMVRVAGAEGKAILDQFDLRVPFVRQLQRLCTQVAKEKGFVKTLSGRRCHFPKKEKPDKDGLYDWTHKALNRVIQGSSADQTKEAVLAATRAGFLPQLQVHDEIDRSVSSVEQAREIAKVMEDCVSLKVPSRVDVEVGPSWGEAK